jgi:ATP-binding cassette subfamily B protein
MSAEQQSRKIDWGLFKRLAAYLKNHPLLVILSFILLILLDISAIITPYLIKIGIDRYILQNDPAGLSTVIILLVIVVSSGFVLQFLFSLCIEYLGQKLLLNLRLDIFTKLLNLSNSYFDEVPTGKSLTVVTNDVEAIREFISEGIISILADLLKVIFIFAAMALINLKLALIIYSVIPLFLITVYIFRKSIRSGYRLVRKATADINTQLVETISGIKEIFLYSYKEKAREQLQNVNREYLNGYLHLIRSFAIFFPVIETISMVILMIILFYSHKTIGKSLKLGEIFAFFSYIHMFFKPLRQLAEQFNILQSALAAAERIFRLLDLKSPVQNPEKPALLPKSQRNTIEFAEVFFSYKTDTPVLKGISFTIAANEKIAIVGPTGSGKTTIAKVLNRFYPINSGSIRFNGISIDQLSLPDLRSQFAVVAQDLYLFNGTIADNISLFHPKFTCQDIRDAAKMAQADSFIEKLPGQYQEIILEEGKRLSQGQKQLLALARAFLFDSPVIILDEATANIDSETEQKIQIATHSLLKNKTAIIIAHRLATIQSADRILVMHQGRIIESGSHQQLIKLNGFYKKLLDYQAVSCR